MKAVPITGRVSLPDALRKIAQQLEEGEFGATDEATVIFPGASEIFHIGGPDCDSPTSAVFNMQCALTKFSLAVLAAREEE